MKPGPSGFRRARWRSAPHESRLGATHPMRAEILSRHERAMRSGLSTYLDPVTGFSVMTAAYLAERSYCCSSGCRHCPWEGGDQDPEPTGGDQVDDDLS